MFHYFIFTLLCPCTSTVMSMSVSLLGRITENIVTYLEVRQVALPYQLDVRQLVFSWVRQNADWGKVCYLQWPRFNRCYFKDSRYHNSNG